MLAPLLLALLPVAGPVLAPDTTVHCDVIVAGGSTAALAAALHAAREGAETCLTEPTGWVGGQLTSEGVSAVDFAWHRVDTLDVAALHRDPANLPPEWAAWFRALGNPGRCWVSVSCFEPRDILARFLLPAIAREPHLHVFHETVPVGVGRRGQWLTELQAVQRFPLIGDGYTRALSAASNDWYDPRNSPFFRKRVLRFTGRAGHTPVFIDATSFGDLLVLSDAPFLQGTDAGDGVPRPGDERCGQALVFPFVLAWDSAASGTAPAPPAAEPADTAGFTLGRYDWARVWTYRRLRAARAEPGPGDLSMQNWESGNDYFGRYLFLPVANARAQARSGWRGGVDTAALAGAERRALGWASWLRAHAPPAVAAHLRLATHVLGTANGLSRLPYLRDSRRSIGLNGYVLPGRDLAAVPGRLTGPAYDDRVALGAYSFDFRVLPGCERPAEAGRPTLPYFIPFRALTSRDVPNLLVAGRTMAQSHVANGATRLHPQEWTTGLAAGVAAAYLERHGLDTAGGLRAIAAIQARIRRYAPLVWTIGGRRFPGPEGP